VGNSLSVAVFIFDGLYPKKYYYRKLNALVPLLSEKKKAVLALTVHRPQNHLSENIF